MVREPPAGKTLAKQSFEFIMSSQMVPERFYWKFEIYVNLGWFKCSWMKKFTPGEQCNCPRWTTTRTRDYQIELLWIFFAFSDDRSCTGRNFIISPGPAKGAFGLIPKFIFRNVAGISPKLDFLMKPDVFTTCNYHVIINNFFHLIFKYH